MGTNYYLILREIYNIIYNNPSKYCLYYKYHIGKNSYGWKFIFRTYPTLNSYIDWIQKINNPKYIILDEYNTVISSANMIEIIKSNTDEQGVKLSQYNISNNKPYNEREKQYLQENPYYRNSNLLIDDYGYTFSISEFS